MKIIGYSVNKRPLLAYEFGNAGKSILILGGVHGNEWEGVYAAERLLSSCSENFELNLRVSIIPCLNPDGYQAGTRLNANGVDLNRNLPTKDWDPRAFDEKYQPGPSALSEPENKGLVSYLEEFTPGLILSLHSWNPLLNVNGDCEDFAKSIQKITGSKIEKSIGYPTPGCLGTYAGLERQMPTLTYEIKRGSTHSEIESNDVNAVLSALKELSREVAK